MSKRDSSGFDLILALFAFAFLLGPIMAVGGGAAAVSEKRNWHVILRVIVALAPGTLIALGLAKAWALWAVLTPAFILTLLIGAWIGRTIGGWKTA